MTHRSAVSPARTSTKAGATELPEAGELRGDALAALLVRNPPHKAAAAGALAGSGYEIDTAKNFVEPPGVPGRSDRPELVPPLRVKQRSMHTVEGRAALIHALAHIELNAINLALDAVWRFAGLPEEFYRDWAKVASEEAKHFVLLASHLESLGFTYGDFSGHDGLWEMARRTEGDVLARVALVPRTLEARGLDASPPIRDKLLAAGDRAGAAILEIILRDEIGHVAIGNRWYRWLCAERGLDPVATYAHLAEEHRAPALKPPFNLQARRAAGSMRTNWLRWRILGRFFRTAENGTVSPSPRGRGWGEGAHLETNLPLRKRRVPSSPPFSRGEKGLNEGLKRRA